MPQPEGDPLDGLDLAQLDQLVVLADGSVLAGLVDRFPATVAMGEQVASALAADDLAQARSTAHQLAGRALNLGGGAGRPDRPRDRDAPRRGPARRRASPGAGASSGAGPGPDRLACLSGGPLVGPRPS